MVSLNLTEEEFKIVIDVMYEHSIYLDSLSDGETDDKYLEKFGNLYRKLVSVSWKNSDVSFGAV
jgi:hypothetical protein